MPDATFSIKTNFPVTPRIPSDIDWLSISEKSYADGILTFSVSATENTDYKRKASIDFVFSDEKVVSSLSIVQEGSKHGNVIYYTTSDDSPIDLLDLTEHSSRFPRDVKLPIHKFHLGNPSGICLPEHGSLRKLHAED